MTRYTALVTRDERSWLIHIPEIDRFTQARNLREIEIMARDLVAVMEQVAPDSFDLNVDVVMPGEAAEHVRRAQELRDSAARAQSEAATELRLAARNLQGTGMPLRDIGKLLDVSYQRAHQLVSS